MKRLPRLRDDLVIKKQTVGQAEVYIVKDPVKQSYYRFETEEFFVLDQLDGEKTATDLAKAYNLRFKDNIKGRDILEFAGSVRALGLFERTAVEENVFLYEQLIEKRKSLIRHAKGSMFYFRIPVVDPNDFFDRLLPWVRWLWSPAAVWLSVMFVFSAVALLTARYEKVHAGMAHLFDFFNRDAGSLLLLWVTVTVVIGLHETGHGMTCKYFGGECREIGFLFMFFTPCMYANVNDAWMFENKRHRLYVTFAGCYFEFIAGSVAVYVWLFTQQGSLLHGIMLNVIVVCFFSAVFMNFNPLMKFDGYFALSDYLEIPNLRTRSRAYLLYLIQTKVFRMHQAFDALTRREKRILAVYGALSSLYMLNVMAGLMFLIGGTLVTYFHGLGVLMTLGVMVKFFGRPAGRGIQFLRQVTIMHKTTLKKPVVMVSTAAVSALALYVFIFVPFACHYTVPATLEPVRQTLVRAHGQGYVASLPCLSMAFEKGQTMLVQTNEALLDDIRGKGIDLEINRLLQNGALAQGDTAECLRLKKLGQKLAEEKKDLERQAGNLTISAPHSGMIAETLHPFEHVMLEKGEAVAHLVSTAVYNASFDIRERDIKGLFEGMPALLVLDHAPWHRFDGTVTAVSPLHRSNGAARIYRVAVSFPNADRRLRAGLSGRVFLKLGNFTPVQRLVRWIKRTVRLELQI